LFKQWTYSPLARLVIGLLSITKIFPERLMHSQPENYWAMKLMKITL